MLRRAKGIEGTLVDHALRAVHALDPADERAFDVSVEGPAALLVAKVHKIAERADTAALLDSWRRTSQSRTWACTGRRDQWPRLQPGLQPNVVGRSVLEGLHGHGGTAKLLVSGPDGTDKHG